MKFMLFSLFAVLVVLSGCAMEGEPETNISEENQTVPEPQCHDSDDGVMEEIAGSVTVSNISYNDECQNDKSLREYYCRNDAVASRLIDCPYGTMCQNGACSGLTAPKEPPEPPTPESFCEDSDGGRKYGTYGEVSSDGMLYQDRCQGNYDLLEYYCDNSQPKQMTVRCEFGQRCEEGACITLETTCSDSDLANPEAAGTTTVYGGEVVVKSQADYCVDETYRKELSCDDGSIKEDVLPCPEHTYCSSGACVPVCKDPDGGKNYDEKATVTAGGESYEDHCAEDNLLVEYYCSKSDALFDFRECDVCHEGVCYDSEDYDCRSVAGGSIIRLVSDSTTIYEVRDSCADYETVKDYRCLDDEIERIYRVCDSHEVCFEGSCTEIVVPMCIDYDGSEERPELVASLTVLTDDEEVEEISEDECINDRTVSEYYCTGTKISVMQMTCAADDICRDGACIYPYTCDETDGGKSLEPGETSLYEDGELVKTETDACASENTVFEVFCDDEGRIKYAWLICPEGLSCDPSDGSCR